MAFFVGGPANGLGESIPIDKYVIEAIVTSSGILGQLGGFFLLPSVWQHFYKVFQLLATQITESPEKSSLLSLLTQIEQNFETRLAKIDNDFMDSQWSSTQ
jgi:hypothetical protein